MPLDFPTLATLLKRYNLRPRKGLGQNFLTDPFHLDKIIEAAELAGEDTVLEVGPGPGFLTRRLAEVVKHVIAVELDAGMIQLLQAEYAFLENLTVLEANILKTDIGAILIDRLPDTAAYKVVANLPYYITSAVLRHILESSPRPERVVVMVQKEVGQRMVATPGNLSVLGVSVQLYGQPHLVHYVPAGAFYPPPKVDSVVVCIDTFAELPIPLADVDHFFAVVKAGFGQKRKQLKNSLAKGLGKSGGEIALALQQASIDPTRRAQTLSLEEWGRLASILLDT